MKKESLTIYLILHILITSMFITLIAGEEYIPPHNNPGPAVDRILFKKVDQDLAPKLIERGDIDIYFYNLKIPTAREYMKSESVKIYQAPSTTISILLNPAPAPDGELNPFSIPEIRFAVNYLIDREYIARSIYGGYAVPMYSHVSSLDYDYLFVSELIRRYQFSYDPDYARVIISKALEKAGAKLEDGKWIYNGKPIELRFIIRVEDERRELGNMLSEELERMGFVVKRNYMDFAQAISIVYRTDPKAFEWHLYTEGWAKGAAEKYDYATINQMCAPWLGYMPGWLEYGFWQYTNDRIDELGKKLFKGEYKDLDERNKLYSEATKLCLEEAVRVWVVIVNNPFALKADLKGISTDIVSGLRSLWTLRSTYTDRHELVVGHLWVRPYMGSAWNPVGGFTDVYSADIWKQLYDPPHIRDPSTGLPKPFRANYKVVESGPLSEIRVPSDAFVWSSEKNSWINVPAGTTAKSKVIFNYARYINSKWHHGVEITLADFLYSLYQSYDLVYNPKKSSVEVSLSATRKPILETFKGFRIINQTSIEVYVDYWHPVEEYVAEYAEPWGVVMPWELLYGMDIMVFEENIAAYTDTAAARLQVDWLDLVEPKQCRRLISIFERLRDQGKYPAEVFNLFGKSYESLANSLKRYNALITWFTNHGHLVVSNGAFYLEAIGSVTEQYAELRAFRDKSYPFTPKDFYVGIPKKIEIYTPTAIQASKDEIIRFDIEVRGVAESYLKISLVDPHTQEILYTELMKVHEGKKTVEIPMEVAAKLKPDIYHIYITAFSNFTSLVVERFIEVSLVEKTLKATETYTTEKTVVTEATVARVADRMSSVLIITIIIITLGILVSIFVVRRKKTKQ
ncbi:MAG: ABC transporter substrate-binding protein [Thaumarchaeota archaeon]|nr:ABC transporter substrate-binding protein [Candidatus Geocrenenecus arthurdayi]